MTHKRVTPVKPIGPVSMVRPLNKENTYFRQLDQWRFFSEVYAEERRFQEALLRPN